MPLTSIRDLPPAAILHEGGHCFQVRDLAPPYGDSLTRPFCSRLMVFEDGKRLGPERTQHHIVRDKGLGRYSYWGRLLFFSTSDNSDPRDNGRHYSIAWADPDGPALPAEIQALLDQTVERLRAGETPEADLETLTTLPHQSWRGWVFYQIAQGLYASRRYDAADEQMLRAWHMGQRDMDVWAQASRWARQHGDDERFRWITRGAAALAAERDDMEWLTAIVLRTHEWLGDLYQMTARSFHQDEFVLAPLATAMARHHRRLLPRRPGTPLRLAYVLAAERSRDYSAIPEIVIELALAHDPREVSVSVISLNERDAVMAENPFFPPWAARLEAAGIPLHFLPAEGGFFGLEQTADTIAAMDLDALVLANATHWNLLLAGLRPARLVTCLGAGEIELFSSPLIDMVFHNTRKPAAEGYGRSEVIRQPFIPPSRFIPRDGVLTRADLDLPQDALIVLSCARAVKYREAAYWRVVHTVLSDCPQAIWVIVGLDRKGFDALACADTLSPDSISRVRFLGWRNDAPAITGLADLFVDTFPNGGGFSAFEAMHLGVPVVAGKESCLTMFDERLWSPVPEVVQQICAPPLDDEAAMADAIMELIRSPEARRDLAARGQQEAQRLTDPTPVAAQIAGLIAGALDTTA